MGGMHVTRIHADQSGKSHFGDIEIGLSPVDFAPPAPALNVSSPEITAQMVFVQLTDDHGAQSMIVQP